MYGKLHEMLLVFECLRHIFISAEVNLLHSFVLVLDHGDLVIQRCHISRVPRHVSGQDKSDHALSETCELLTMQIFNEVEPGCIKNSK